EAGVGRADAIDFSAMSSERDKKEILAVGQRAQAASNLVPVEVWHPDVDERRGCGMAPSEIDRGVAVVGGEHVEPTDRQCFGQEPARVRIVVDHEDQDTTVFFDHKETPPAAATRRFYCWREGSATRTTWGEAFGPAECDA